MDIKECVMTNLDALGIQGVKGGTLKHLVKIQEMLASAVQAQNDAIREVKEHNLSINRIAKETGISRQTFYNNPILLQYIEHYLDANVLANPYDVIESQKESIRSKDAQISEFVKRDATVEKYRAQNDALLEQIASLQATIRSQEDLICSLRRAVSKKISIE